MSFQQIISAIWRNRDTFIVRAVFYLTLIGLLLFIFHPGFRVAVVDAVVSFVTFIFICLFLFFGGSLMWKGAVSNIKGGGGGKKKKK